VLAAGALVIAEEVSAVSVTVTVLVTAEEVSDVSLTVIVLVPVTEVPTTFVIVTVLVTADEVPAASVLPVVNEVLSAAFPYHPPGKFMSCPQKEVEN